MIPTKAARRARLGLVLRPLQLALMVLGVALNVAALAADTIKIAFIDPLSGPLAAIGESNLRQAQAAAAHANRHGGALGLRFEIVPFDSKASAEEALGALSAATEQAIRYVMQGVGSRVAAALLEAIESHNSLNPSRSILFLNYGISDPELANEQCSFWHFAFDASRSIRIEALANVMADDESIRRVVLLNPDTGSGRGTAAEAGRRLLDKGAGIEIVGDKLHPVGKQAEIAALAEWLVATRPDAVMTSSRREELAAFVQAVEKANLGTRFFLLHGSARGTANAVGEAGIGRVTTVLAWHPNIPNNQLEGFANAYKTRHDEDWVSLSSYIAIQMLAIAIESTRTLDPLRVARMLEGIDFLGPTGPVRMRRDDHQLLQPIYVATFTRAGADGVKHGVGNSGFGWKTDVRLEPDQTVVPTTCRMRRPG